MANCRTRGSGLFAGLVLISVGAMLLLHNYRGFDIGQVLGHWWPLLLILWGAIKLYERTAGRQAGEPGAARITAGEIFLVLGLLALIGAVVAVDYGRQHIPGGLLELGEPFSFDLDVAPKPVPADARITIRGIRGDINVRASDTPEIRVSGKKNLHGWNESDAQRLADAVSVEVVQNGDAFEVRPVGSSSGDSRVSMDVEISVPKRASLSIRSEKGDIRVAGMAADLAINSQNGDLEVRDTAGDVSIDMRHGDAKVTDTTGNIKISGKGGEIEVVGSTGSLTLDGEFYGPVRASKLAKGVRFVSSRTDLTLTQLSGHMEASSGNLQVFDAPGNLALHTHDDEIGIENAGGKVKIDNRNGSVELRFSSPPKDDIEVTNSSAGIILSLPGSANFEMQAECHSGDIDSEFSADSLKKTTTQSGDAHLEGKYGSGRGPRITLKTSYGSISLRRTSGAPPPPLPPPPLKAPSPIPPTEEH